MVWVVGDPGQNVRQIGLRRKSILFVSSVDVVHTSAWRRDSVRTIVVQCHPSLLLIDVLPAGPPNDRSGREILARMSRLAVGAVDPSVVDSAR